MKCSWIEPGVLAAGPGPYRADDIRALHARGIRAIVTLTEQPLSIYRELTPELFERLDILCAYLPIRDNYPPSVPQARELLELIRDFTRQGRPTFVHCNAGIGRTGTILHLYYLAQGRSMAEARALVKARRIQCILLSDAQRAFLENW